MSRRAHHASSFDLQPALRRQDHIHDPHLLDLIQDLSRLLTQAGAFAPLRQRLPQHVRQEADQNVRLDALLFLMPDRPQAQVALVNPERALDLPVRLRPKSELLYRPSLGL